MNKLAPYYKAAVGFLAPGAVVLTASVLEGSAAGETITAGEWVTALCACVISGAGVYSVRNRAS